MPHRFLTASEIAPGSLWVAIDGSRGIVEVLNVDDKWVFYKRCNEFYRKGIFAFQCRYTPRND